MFRRVIEDGGLPRPDKAAGNELLREKIEALLKTLTYREREIIRLRYGLGDGYTYTLEEVGRIFKVTRERVRQIEAKAVKKLQHPVRSQQLEGFLEHRHGSFEQPAELSETSGWLRRAPSRRSPDRRLFLFSELSLKISSIAVHPFPHPNNPPNVHYSQCRDFHPSHPSSHPSSVDRPEGAARPRPATGPCGRGEHQAS